MSSLTSNSCRNQQNTNTHNINEEFLKRWCVMRMISEIIVNYNAPSAPLHHEQPPKSVKNNH